MSDRKKQSKEVVIVVDRRVGLAVLGVFLVILSLVAGAFLGRQLAGREATMGQTLPPAAPGVPWPAAPALPPAPAAGSARSEAQPRTELPAGASSTRARLNEPAPEFGLETLEGEMVHLSDFRGQAVMINFWATWCPPCRFEMPMLESAWRKYKDQGFVILGVNTGERVRAGRLREEVQFFVDQMGLTFPILLDAEDRVADLYNLRAYPTSFFISPDGELVAARRGAFPSPAELEQFIIRVLNPAEQR